MKIEVIWSKRDEVWVCTGCDHVSDEGPESVSHDPKCALYRVPTPPTGGRVAETVDVADTYHDIARRITNKSCEMGDILTDKQFDDLETFVKLQLVPVDDVISQLAEIAPYVTNKGEHESCYVPVWIVRKAEKIKAAIEAKQDNH